jgi:hypothetical protein
VEQISRRDALKRGAAIGAGVLWATPAVQVVSMARSAAAAASPVPPKAECYAVAISDRGRCYDIWDQEGRDSNPDSHKCLTPSAHYDVQRGGCYKIKHIKVPDGDHHDDHKGGWYITLCDGCVVVAAKGKTRYGCVDVEFRQRDQSFAFPSHTPGGKRILRLELIICCRPEK